VIPGRQFRGEKSLDACHVIKSKTSTSSWEEASSDTRKEKPPDSERLLSLARLTSINSVRLPWLRLCVHDDGRDALSAFL
jgi:hypothetical protein